MENLIKTLLLEGIDEDTIHRVLDVIEEEYEVVNELKQETYASAFQKRADQHDTKIDKIGKEWEGARAKGDREAAKVATDKEAAEIADFDKVTKKYEKVAKRNK